MTKCLTEDCKNRNRLENTLCDRCLLKEFPKLKTEKELRKLLLTRRPVYFSG